ncbi:MAG: ABC transporter transmembrane domain-containing protein, partial [Negativicutes bacterium]|nr:ABC transporter transmembrane domain-containing protein [Negativicutes bacterium]
MLKFYWQRFVRHHYRRIGGGILCLILSSLAGLAAPLIIKMFIDRALARHDLKILAFIAYAIVAIYALRAVFAWAYSLLMSRLGNTTIMELRSEMYQRLNKLRFSYFIDRPAGTAISLFVDDLILLQQVMVNAIPDLIVETLSLAAIFSIMIVLNWRLALITIFILPSTILLIQNFNRRIVRLAERIDLSQKSVVSLLQQSIASIREVQSYNREEYEYQRFNREIQRVTGSLTGIQYLKAAFIPLVEFMAAIGLTIVVWWGGREVVF